MNIIIASEAGFCFGVNRAVEMTRKVLAQKEKPVFSLGPIIHNPGFIAELEKKGLQVVESMDEIDANEGFFIVRSHGTIPDVIKKAQEKGLNIIDTTCPFVKKAQEAAKSFYEKDFEVVVFGDREHAEVIGINAQAQNLAKIIWDENDLELVDFSKPIGILSQTTQKNENFSKIINLIENKAENKIVVENTICLDSTEKKEQIRKLASENDAVVIVGGKISNNTKKLAEVAKTQNKNTYHVESPAELDKSWFEGAGSVVISAGASTPREHIGLVKEAIGNLSVSRE